MMNANEYLKSESHKTISEVLWNLGFDDDAINLVHQLILRELRWRTEGDFTDECFKPF